MPSSRRPRARAQPGVPAPVRQCRALLTDEATHCTSRTQGRAKYCGAHGHEYGQLTGAYKDASSRVDVLAPEIQRTWASVGGLCTVAAVDAAVVLAHKYFDALGEEIDGRETHHKRFFQEGACVAGHVRVRMLRSLAVDESHEKWLRRRRGEQESAVRLLERLRRHRKEISATEAATRRIEERRKAYEAERRAAAEARWGATESHGAHAPGKAVQARSVLGERTNAATGTGSQRGALPNAVGNSVAGRVPPGYWPAVGPSPRLPPPQRPAPRPQHQPLPYPSAPQRAGERRPLLRPADIPRGYVPGANVNSSWLVDVESQSRNAAQLRGCVHQTSLHVGSDEAADPGCGCTRIIFWLAALYVFCNLVAAGYLLQSSIDR